MRILSPRPGSRVPGGHPPPAPPILHTAPRAPPPERVVFSFSVPNRFTADMISAATNLWGHIYLLNKNVDITIYILTTVVLDLKWNLDAKFNRKCTRIAFIKLCRLHSDP